MPAQTAQGHVRPSLHLPHWSASALFLVQHSPWQASWVDFCRSWMTICVLDSDSPGWGPEPARLFTFDLLLNFLEEVGWTEDQRLFACFLFSPTTGATLAGQPSSGDQLTISKVLTPWQRAQLKWTLDSIGKDLCFSLNLQVKTSSVSTHTQRPLWGNSSFLPPIPPEPYLFPNKTRFCLQNKVLGHSSPMNTQIWNIKDKEHDGLPGF